MILPGVIASSQVIASGGAPPAGGAGQDWIDNYDTTDDSTSVNIVANTANGRNSVAQMSSTKSFVAIRYSTSQVRVYLYSRSGTTATIEQEQWAHNTNSTLQSGTNDIAYGVTALTATTALVYWINDDDNKLYSRVLTDNGTTFTMGALQASGFIYVDRDNVDCTLLSAGKLVFGYRYNNGGQKHALVATVSGDTVTYNTPYAVSTDTSSTDAMAVSRLDDTHVAFAFIRWGSPIMEFYVLTESSGTLSEAASTTEDTGSSTYIRASHRIIAHSATHLTYVYNDNSATYAYGISLNPSTWAISMGARTTIDPPTDLCAPGGAFIIDDSTFLVCSSVGAAPYNDNLGVRICSKPTDTTINVGARQQITSLTSTDGHIGGSITPDDENYAIITHQYNGYGNGVSIKVLWNGQ